MNFYDNYTSNYFLLPIYFLIEIFQEIHLQYENYVKIVYDNNNETIPFYNN